MGDDEGQTQQCHEDVSGGLTNQSEACADNDTWCTERQHLDDQLPTVLEVGAVGDLQLQGDGLFVIDSQLEDNEMDQTTSQTHVGDHHQPGELACEDCWQHDEEGDEQGDGVEPEFGLEQGDDVLLVHHEQVDVIALLSHELRERGDTEERKAVDAPEVGHERAVIDIGIGRERGEDDDQRETHDTATPHGTITHGGLELYLQVFANDSETVEETKLRDMLQGAFFLLGDLLIDKPELEETIDEEERGETSNQDWQEPTAAPEGGIEVEHLGEGTYVEFQQPGSEGQHIEGDGSQEPQHIAIDERTEEEIDLTVEHDEQHTPDEFHQDRPETCTSDEDDDGIGQEHGEPQEVEAAEMGGDEETLDGRIARDRLQDIGFHHHTWCGLENETQQIVEQQDHGHHRHHHTSIAIG